MGAAVNYVILNKEVDYLEKCSPEIECRGHFKGRKRWLPLTDIEKAVSIACFPNYTPLFLPPPFAPHLFKENVPSKNIAEIFDFIRWIVKEDDRKKKFSKNKYIDIYIFLYTRGAKLIPYASRRKIEIFSL